MHYGWPRSVAGQVRDMTEKTHLLSGCSAHNREMRDRLFVCATNLIRADKVVSIQVVGIPAKM